MALPALDAVKPAGSVRTHLLLAALMWSVVGLALLSVGAWWVVQAYHAATALWLIPLCAIAGQLKAHFVLRRAASRTIARIEARGDGRCLGGFISLRTWGLVVLMMGLGYALRHGLLPRLVVGPLYVAIGTALASASRPLWHAWHRHPPRSSPASLQG